MVDEARTLAPEAYVCSKEHDVYLRTDPRSWSGPTGNTTVGSVPSDLLSPEGPLAVLYKNEAFITFLSRVCLGFGIGDATRTLHPLADPLGACTINVFHPGDGHWWHFDEAPFTTTIMLQPATLGGRFEVVADAVGSRLDRALAGLSSAVDGTPSLGGGATNDRQSIGNDRGTIQDAVDLKFEEPGTLSIFAGSRSLHRVSGSL